MACSLVLVLLASAYNVDAIPLATYHEHVHQSLIALDSLQAEDEDVNDAAHEARIIQTLDEIRRLLPSAEKVEWDGSSIEVDNKWLESALQEFAELSLSAEQRRALLTETAERLSTLDQALTELEGIDANAAGPSSKDEAKTRLANILRRDEYSRKTDEGSALTRLWHRFTAWLRSLMLRGPGIEPGRSGLLSTIAQILVVALALGVIAFGVWKVSPLISQINTKRKKSGKPQARVVLGESLEPDQTSADLLAEADALARDGHLRAAIRKGYIALLCELGDRKLLGLAQHKTNRDYLRSLRSHEQLYLEMQILTNSFEGHWYGFVPASMDDWTKFRAHYQQALARQI